MELSAAGQSLVKAREKSLASLPSRSTGQNTVQNAGSAHPEGGDASGPGGPGIRPGEAGIRPGEAGVGVDVLRSVGSPHSAHAALLRSRRVSRDPHTHTTHTKSPLCSGLDVDPHTYTHTSITRLDV